MTSREGKQVLCVYSGKAALMYTLRSGLYRYIY